ncbi:MAG: DUF6308 family protein [Euzebya sp.]
MAQQQLTVAGDSISLEVAQTCIGRYCSAPATRWEPDPSRVVQIDADRLRFFADGYRSYDCIPGGPDRELLPVDILVAAGLGAGLQQGAVDALLGLLPELNQVIADISDPAPCFWELSREELFDEGGIAAFGSPMWTAWALLMNLQGVTILTTHAILHHKFPTLYPLLDRRTVGHFSRRSQAWKETHEDLVRDADAWTELENWHRDAIVPRSPAGAVPLNRLRLHAVILDTRTV